MKLTGTIEVLMADLKKVLILKEIMDSLSSGVDPISKEPLPTDTLLSNKYIQSCFVDISNILDQVLQSGMVKEIVDGRFKYPFILLDKDKEKIDLSCTPTTIGEFTNLINTNRNAKYLKKLRPTQITNWLEVNRYLENVTLEDGFFFRKATHEGQAIGIQSIPKTTSLGTEYVVNLYNENAKRFILDKMDDIVRFSNNDI